MTLSCGALLKNVIVNCSFPEGRCFFGKPVYTARKISLLRSGNVRSKESVLFVSFAAEFMMRKMSRVCLSGLLRVPYI